MSRKAARLRSICAVTAAVAAMLLWRAGASAKPPVRLEAASGRELYEAGCATCHGSDGRGITAGMSSYPIAVPDFTDCNFATREPNLDWIAVAHDGGPARGFDRLMPAFGELLTPEELERTVEHIRSFCREDEWPRGELNLPRALVTSKAFPEDEAGLRVAAGEDQVTSRLVVAARVGALNQLEVVVPVTVLRADDGDWTGGLGDVAFAFKRVLVHGLEWGGIVSAAVELSVPTGDAERGLGAGTPVLEPFLAYGLLLSERSFVQFQLGGAVPGDRKKADELFARTVLGRRFLEAGGYGRAWTPMVELLGARELARGAVTHVDVVPQLQVTLSARQHVVANAGVRLPLYGGEDRPTEIMAYVIWDWFDGGFFAGW